MVKDYRRSTPLQQSNRGVYLSERVTKTISGRDLEGQTATQLPMDGLERLDIYSPIDLADHTIPGIRHSDIRNTKTYVIPMMVI